MKTPAPAHPVTLAAYLPRLLALGLLALIVLLALTGCQKNGLATNNNSDLAGVYQLVSVDGRAVPCALAHDGATLTIQSGTFTIAKNGHGRSAVTFSVPARGDLKKEVNATCQRQGMELTLHWEGAGTTTGNVTGDRFTMNNEGVLWAYQK